MTSNAKCNNAITIDTAYPESLDELLHYVKLLCLFGSEMACRGQSFDFGNGSLYSSLDRFLRQSKSTAGLAVEREIWIRFTQYAQLSLSNAELMNFNDPWFRLMLMRHCGVPTRLLDWTFSPWIASYFAVHDNFDSDGILFAFNVDKFDFFNHILHREHTKHALDTKNGIPSIFVTDLGDWVYRLVRTGPQFPSMVVQQGLFTFGGKLGLDHWQVILKVLSADDRDRHCRLIRIRKELKPYMLRYLETLGIRGMSLFPGLDGIGRSMADFARCSGPVDQALVWGKEKLEEIKGKLANRTAHAPLRGSDASTTGEISAL